MEMKERDLLVARICSGKSRIKVNTGGKLKTLFVVRPTADQLYEAQEIYHDQLHLASMKELMNEEQLVEFLLDKGFWDEEKDKMLTDLPKDIEKWKVELFKASFKSEKRKLIRKSLKIARDKFEELYTIRHSYDHLSDVGFATVARSRFILACTLCNRDGTPLYPDLDCFWEQSDTQFFETLVSQFGASRIPENKIRELARTEPWRTIWACRKAEGAVFGVPSSAYTDEQRVLVGYSMLYDSIMEHPECPSDDIIQDDDMIDGWLIVQRKKREKEQKQKTGDEVTGNEKIKNSQEVYLMADTIDDARDIEELNDGVASAIKRKRMRKLEDEGTVREMDMPDTRRRRQMEATQLLSQNMKSVSGG